MEPVWIIRLANAVATAECRSDVLRELGLTTNGSGNHRIVQKWILKLGIDTSHFNVNKSRGKRSVYQKQQSMDISKVLIEGTVLTTSNKRKLKTLLLYECALCKNIGEHRGIPLSLQIDHINGIHTDNRIQNLRWLCPNCHTQTPTYGSKRLKNTGTPKQKQIKDVNWRSRPRPSRRKVKRPDYNTLKQLLKTETYAAVGKKFGVSDNSIRKWLKYEKGG